MRILFVCTGNTCRSPMAETLLRHMIAQEKITNVEVSSRGVGALEGEPASSGTRAALKEIGLNVDAHRSRPLTAAEVRQADLILVMEDGHRAIIASDYPDAMKKTFLLKTYTGAGATEIADPIGGSPEDYQKCRIEIQDCLLGLLSKLKERKTTS